MMSLFNSAMSNYFITEWNNLYYKLVQILQSGATLYYKVGHTLLENKSALRCYKAGLKLWRSQKGSLL